MANLDAAFGMNPIGKIGGGTAYAANSYITLSSYGVALFQGDAVRIAEGGGDVVLFAAADGGTDATNCIGVFWGVNYDDATTGKPIFSNQKAVSLATTCFVYDDPYQVFEIQDAGSGAQTDISMTSDITAGTGSTTTGVSGNEAAGFATSAAGNDNLRCVGFSKKVGRNAFGANTVAEVLINEHKYKE